MISCTGWPTISVMVLGLNCSSVNTTVSVCAAKKSYSRVGHAPGAASDKLTDSEVSRRELRQLKWLTALVPGTVVLIYEYARQETLEHVLPALPVQYGNVVVWVLVLVLTYAFAAFVFRIVERLQAQALARSRDLVTLNAVIEERARLSRELHDGFAQLVAYMLVRLDTVTGLVRASRGN